PLHEFASSANFWNRSNVTPSCRKILKNNGGPISPSALQRNRHGSPIGTIPALVVFCLSRGESQTSCRVFELQAQHSRRNLALPGHGFSRAVRCASVMRL